MKAGEGFRLLPRHVAFPKVLRQHAVARQQAVHIVFVIGHKGRCFHTYSLTEVSTYAQIGLQLQ